MTRFMYVTEGNKLVGMQDVSDWPIRAVYTANHALQSAGRDGFVSDKGVSICAFCRVIIREVEIPAGQISHGICPACEASEWAKVSKLLTVRKQAD